MDKELIQHLEEDALVDASELHALKACADNRTVSVNADLKMLLYIGILALCGGLGIIVYKNIESIGHIAIITAVGLVSAGCFVYCFKTALPFSRRKVESSNLWFDYVLLLGCLLMLTFVGYIQFEYHFFGVEWGLATFLPMLVLFFMAYYFDHAGVLSMAITMLAGWMGIALKPMHYIRYGRTDTEGLIWNGVTLGLLLHLLQLISERLTFKPHFGGVYKNFGVHILMLAMIGGLFFFEHQYMLWWVAIAAVAGFHFYEGMLHHAFYYVLVALLYAYFDVSYMVIRLLLTAHSEDITVVLLYFIASGLGLVMLLIYLNKKLRHYDSI